MVGGLCCASAVHRRLPSTQLAFAGGDTFASLSAVWLTSRRLEWNRALTQSRPRHSLAPFSSATNHAGAMQWIALGSSSMLGSFSSDALWRLSDATQPAHTGLDQDRCLESGSSVCPWLRKHGHNSE